MAAALRFERANSIRPHNWLALVPEGFLYQRFVSDLAGFDPGRHAQSVSSVIREVSAWLRLQEDSIDPAPSALDIFKSFDSFGQKVIDLQTAAMEKEAWADLVLASYQTVPRP